MASKKPRRVFQRRLRSSGNSHVHHENLVKTVSLAVSVLTLLGGVIAFFVQQSAEADIRDRQSQQAFLEKQLKTYTKAVKTVSELVLFPGKDDDRIKYDQNLKTFWRLYYGELAMVEDRRVETVMAAMGALLSKEGGRPHLEEPCVKLKRHLSLTLAHCARKSIGDGWGVNLESANKYCSKERLSDLSKQREKTPICYKRHPS